MVFVVGEPGIGKSRLLLELHRRVGAAAAWHEGHCLSFGKAMAFHPLVDLIRRWFGVEESDGEAAIAAKLERGVAEIGADLGPVTPYLRALLSIDPGDDGVRAMSLAMPVEPGMVFCVETPYYEHPWGGVQVEDAVEITAGGVRMLTRSSQELQVVG